jgi:endonuclease/exonuclease/phosphatase family metal-dependent hydrolase
MKTLFLCLFLALNPPADSLKVLFWNLENFFDWRNDSTSVADAEFSSFGARRWTRKRFNAKSNAIAKGLLWAGAPDVIGLAEVENAFVLKRLLAETALRKMDYKIVHFDSPDSRGIDVALLYRSSRLILADAKPCHLFAADSSVLATRDILLVRFKDPDIAFLVNHHPSKYGGAAVSEARRQIAVQRLKQLADSLQGLGITRIVAMGDMNDTPANPVYRQLEPTLMNLAEPLYRQGEGTIKYDGAWELIDMIFVSSATGAGPMQILQIPFLMTRDATHAGTKPLRTYSGPRYLGGVSDHCPVMATIPLKH